MPDDTSIPPHKESLLDKFNRFIDNLTTKQILFLMMGSIAIIVIAIAIAGGFGKGPECIPYPCDECGGYTLDTCDNVIKCESCPRCPSYCKTVFREKLEEPCYSEDGECMLNNDGSYNPNCYYVRDIKCKNKEKTAKVSISKKCIDASSMQGREEICLRK